MENYIRVLNLGDALMLQHHLRGWHVDLQPLIFSRSPAGFDEQTAFTLRAYRELDWEAFQRDKRPAYGNPDREAETAEEE